MVGKAAGSWNPMRVQSSFFEETKKGDYEVELPLSVAEATKRVKEGASLVIPESKKWIREVTQKYRADELLFSEHGDYENLWKFGNQEVLDSWVTTADRDHNEGQSTAEFVLGPGKQGIFRGNLSVDVPKDGKTKQSGYCNIRSPMNHVNKLYNTYKYRKLELWNFVRNFKNRIEKGWMLISDMEP